MGNRAIDREALRSRIVDAALAEMLRKGFDAARIEDIAVRAGVAKGTYYNFFATKAEVLLERYGDLDAQFQALRMDMRPAQPVLSIHRFVRRAEALLREAGDLLRVIIENGSKLQRLSETDRESGQQDQQQMAQFLRAAQLQGALDARANPEQLAATFQLLWTGQTYVWAISNMSFFLAKALAPHIELLFSPYVTEKRKSRA